MNFDFLKKNSIFILRNKKIMALSVGDKAPNFKLYNSDKEEVKLGDFKGQNVVSVSYTHLTLPTILLV